MALDRVGVIDGQSATGAEIVDSVMLGEIIQAAKTKYMTAVKRKRGQQQFETDAAFEILPIHCAEILKYLLFRPIHGRNLVATCGTSCQSAPGKLPEILLSYFGG